MLLRQMIGFCSSPLLVEHTTGPHHPERPDRLRVIYKSLIQTGLLALDDPFANYAFKLSLPPAKCPPMLPITPQRADEKQILTVHSQRLVDKIRHVCQVGGGVLDQGDTPIGPMSYECGMLSAGCAIAATDAVLTGKVRRAFAAGRPPGHHAEVDRAMGFCLFDNVAIAARHAQKVHGLQRIAIVDIDVHHGNGTQAIFEADPSVLFISLHQHPRTCYPGTGYEWEIGTGSGRGYTLNIPLNPATDDAEYLKILDARVIPELLEYRPEMIFLSTGFDAHQDDAIADLRLTDDGFELVTRVFTAAADHLCQGRLVSVLEGGYSLPALARCVVRHCVGLSS